MPLGSRHCFVFNIYISDIPKTKSRQCGYADNLAICAKPINAGMLVYGRRNTNISHGTVNRIAENVHGESSN